MKNVAITGRDGNVDAEKGGTFDRLSSRVGNPFAIPAVEGQSAQNVGLAPAGLTNVEARSAEPDQVRRDPYPRARIMNAGDRIFTAVTSGFAGLIIVTLVVILGVLIYQSHVSITQFGLSFLTDSTWNTVTNQFGGRAPILGTLYTSLLALLIAAPVSVMVAIYLVEMAPRWLRFPLGFLIELLAAVPSIVYGLWALFVLVPLIQNDIQPPIVDHFGNIPLFSGYPLGLGIFTASLILSIMILPTIAAISRDVMMAVPNSQRDAMLALGATRWETTWKAVIPYARSGIIGGILLGLGRAVGETMAVQMVIGSRQDIGISLFQPSTTMATTIVSELAEATADLHRSSLIELALVLMLLTVLLNAGARLLVWRVAR